MEYIKKPFKIKSTPEGITCIDEINKDKLGLYQKKFFLYCDTNLIEYMDFFVIHVDNKIFQLVSFSEVPKKVSDNCFEYLCKIVTLDVEEYIPKELLRDDVECILYSVSKNDKCENEKL